MKDAHCYDVERSVAICRCTMVKMLVTKKNNYLTTGEVNLHLNVTDEKRYFK